MNISKRSPKQLYLEELRTNCTWRTFLRPRVLARANGRCEICGASSEHLDCHHLRHRGPIGTEQLDDLLALCRSCHDRHHQDDAMLLKAAAYDISLVRQKAVLEAYEYSVPRLLHFVAPCTWESHSALVSASCTVSREASSAPWLPPIVASHRNGTMEVIAAPRYFVGDLGHVRAWIVQMDEDEHDLFLAMLTQAKGLRDAAEFYGVPAACALSP